MPKGYSATGGIVGAAAKKYYPGMIRTCADGHDYTITDAMSERRNYSCPKCNSIKAVEYAKKNREKKRIWNNAYHARISSDRAEATAAWRANHPQKRLAHQAVQSALRNGSLKKQPCEVCGSAKRIHAHHDDYSHQLQVTWLCHTHHMERHAMLSAREAS